MLEPNLVDECVATQTLRKVLLSAIGMERSRTIPVKVFRLEVGVDSCGESKYGSLVHKKTSEL